MLYEPVNKRNLVNVEELINRYFTSLGVYYFTIHTHLHLVKQVEDHGPVKSHSQLVFEVVTFLCNKNFN